MKIKKQKYLIYSTIILILGIFYFITIDYLNYIDFWSQFKDRTFIFIPRGGKFDTIWFKLIAIGFGLISLYFSFKSKIQNQKKRRIILISLSLLLIIMSIGIFPNLRIQF